MIVFILFAQKWNRVHLKGPSCGHVTYQKIEWKLNHGIDHPPHFPKARNYSSNFSLIYELPILQKIFTRGSTAESIARTAHVRKNLFL